MPRMGLSEHLGSSRACHRRIDPAQRSGQNSALQLQAPQEGRWAAECLVPQPFRVGMCAARLPTKRGLCRCKQNLGKKQPIL